MTKKTRSYLPKRIAGVKVPKSVRKGRLGELLASPEGPALLADALRGFGAHDRVVAVTENGAEVRWPELPAGGAEAPPSPT